MPQIKTTKYKELINLVKLKHIVNNPKQYKSIIEKCDEARKKWSKDKYHTPTYTILEKLVKNCEVPLEYQGTEMGILNVSYLNGRNSHNRGRKYAKDSIGLQSLVNCVRHTICEGIWTDIDMENAHPVLLQQLFKRHNLNSPMLNECVDDREGFLKKINDDRAIAKRKVISTINGAVYVNHKFLHKFHKEVRPLITKIVYSDEWKEITDDVRIDYRDLGESKIIDKSISRILQVIENDILEHYLDWAYSKGFIDNKNNFVSLIFDGFMILNKFNITDDILDECRKYALMKTGYDVVLKIKPFDNCIVLPDNYAKTLSVRAELVHKYLSNLDSIMLDNKTRIEVMINNGGTHNSIAELAYKIFEGDFYYDDKQKTWYYYNYANIWCETADTDILRYLIQTVMKALMEKYAWSIIQDELNNLVEGDVRQAILQERQKKCIKGSKEIQNWCFVSKVCENARVFYLKSDFFKDYIDSKPHLFAFNNKVYDFKENKIRPIRPDDYIMNTCGYNYPENVKQEDTDFVINYFKSLFPDEDMFNYLLDTCSSTLNGDKREQYLNIHTGCGSNSKSTFSGLFETILGGYGVNIPPATFTKPPKGANDTGELWRAKGTRGLFSNEPDDGDKLQTAILKAIADSCNRTIKARGLYKENIEFHITFQLNIFCNNKPELSSVDGGIGRRVRVIDWKMKFVDADDYDKNNPCHRLKDSYMMSKITTPEIRDAFIKLLLDRWESRVSKLSAIPVPEAVKKASASYVADSNPVLGFVMDKIDITNNAKDTVLSSTLYTLFNDRTISQTRFKNDLKGLGIESKRGGKGIVYYGIKIKEDKEDEDDDES